MASPEEHYETVMRDARETVFLVAGRRSIDTRLIDVEFDAGLGPGPHQRHVIVISLRNAPIAVTEKDIPHEWFTNGTGFIDTRFSKLISWLISELLAKVHEAGLNIE